MYKLISKSVSYRSKWTPSQMTHLSRSLLYMFSIEKMEARKGLALNARLACLCYQRNDPRRYWVEMPVGDEGQVSFSQLEHCAVLLISAPSFQDENSHSFSELLREL